MAICILCENFNENGTCDAVGEKLNELGYPKDESTFKPADPEETSECPDYDPIPITDWPEEYRDRSAEWEEHMMEKADFDRDDAKIYGDKMSAYWPNH